MPPRKKKTQLKKVDRGYATTSIPKKVAPPEPSSEQPIETNAEQSNGGSADEPKVAELVHDENDAPLQRLVDRYQERTEKEIVRTLKTVEYDRRMTKGLPQVDIEEDLINEIIELVIKEESQRENLKLFGASREKLTSQIGVTYGVLRRLGFSEETVMRCLREASGVELAQAFDWLYIHCPTSDLEFERLSNDVTENTPQTPRSPDNLSAPSTPKQLNKKTLPPSSSLVGSKSNHTESGDVIEGKARDSCPTGHSSAPDLMGSESSEDASDIEDPNAEYVRLKLRIYELTGHRRRQDEMEGNGLLKKLQVRLESVKKDYFFREKDAEATFQDKRREVDQAMLISRLRGDAEPVRSAKPAKKVVEAAEPPKVDRPSEDIFDTSDDEETALGGMFGLLEPMPTTETTDNGVTITVKDMSMPKQWAGRTPKLLLQEFVSRSDRYAAIVYKEISGSSRAKRASVSIRWSRKGAIDEWAMEDVACFDLIQAEQYIATVALHASTYPSNSGFRSASGNPKGAQTSYRHLPAVFRELWDELEARRKEDEDRANRDIWKSLSSVLDQKYSTEQKAGDKLPKEPSSKERSQPKERTVNDATSEQLKSAFFARQLSPLYQEMLAFRNVLPIAPFRQTISEALEMSQVVVLSGETGCGKSTQLPSFILEDQLSKGQRCKIVVTEPRRISAVSLANRVSRELGDPPGAVGTNASLVGYSIRLESHTSKSTRLNFVTNGIALRMLEGGSGGYGNGTAFDEVTHIIVDEVHERSIDSDFLLIILKTLLQERGDLKIVLMSATLDAEKISNYFGGCPIIQVPGRTFPVDVRFLEDTLEYTRWTITESSPYAKRINDKFNRANKVEWSEDTARNEDDDEDTNGSEPDAQAKLGLQTQRYSPRTIAMMNLLDERQIPYELIVHILERLCDDRSLSHLSSAFLIFMPGLAEIRRLNDILVEHPFLGSDAFRIFPLHSTISNENQNLVFDIPPPGIRKIVIATNIAETGVTIPDITCVIDTGKHREMRFDEKRQISRLIETFIARSNAAQRRGRAGRVRSGICFHLFSKARHDLMAEHPLPEMLRLSLSDLALRIKILKVNLGSSIEDALARSLDPPSSINVQRAKAALTEVGALTPTEEITDMGRFLSKFPTDVHLGKFLLIAALLRCLDPALTIAAALNSKSPFITPFGMEQEAGRAKSSFRIGNSDFLTIHNAFNSWRRASANPGFVRKFCRQNFLSHQNLQQIEELRQQFLAYLVDSSFIKVDKDVVQELSHARYTRGYRTRFVSVPVEYDRNNDDNMALLNAALCAGLYPKLLVLQDKQQLRTLGNNQLVAFHPSSVNFGKRPSDFGVNYLCYFTIMQSKRLYAWETGPVDDLAVILLCGDCEFKLISDTLVIDRKIRFRLAPKTSIALKYLRANLAYNLVTQFKGKVLTERQQKWDTLVMRALGKVKSEVNDDGSGIIVH